MFINILVFSQVLVQEAEADLVIVEVDVVEEVDVEAVVDVEEDAEVGTRGVMLKIGVYTWIHATILLSRVKEYIWILAIRMLQEFVDARHWSDMFMKTSQIHLEFLGE